MKQIKRKLECPINFALEVFSDKLTFLLVRELIFKGKSFYGEFLLSVEGIATNNLTDKMSLSEISGIISKANNLKHKQKIKYRLTPKGIDLVSLLVEVILCTAKNDKDSATDFKFVKSVKRDKVSLIYQISNRLVEDLSVM